MRGLTDYCPGKVGNDGPASGVCGIAGLSVEMFICPSEPGKETSFGTVGTLDPIESTELGIPGNVGMIFVVSLASGKLGSSLLETTIGFICVPRSDAP